MSRRQDNAGCGGGTHTWKTRLYMIKSTQNCSLTIPVGEICFQFSTRRLVDHTKFFTVLITANTNFSLTATSNQVSASMPAGGAGGGGGNRPGGGGNRIGGSGTKNSRQTASKGAEKKIAKQPIKAIKEKVVAAKEKAKAKKAEKKASHDARRADYDNKGDDELRHERTTRQQTQDRF